MVLCLHQNLVIIITSLLIELSMSYLYHFYNTDHKWSLYFAVKKIRMTLNLIPLIYAFL